MAPTINEKSLGGHGKVVTVAGLVNAGGNSAAFKVGEEGYRRVVVTGAAAVNPTGIVTFTLQGSEDGVNWSTMSTLTGFYPTALQISTAGTATLTYITFAPPFMRVLQHSDATGDLSVIFSCYKD